jgi:hypothetical protein
MVLFTKEYFPNFVFFKRQDLWGWSETKSPAAIYLAIVPALDDKW